MASALASSIPWVSTSPGILSSFPPFAVFSARRWFAETRKTSLLDISDDILLEIMYLLDPRSIVLFRRVSHRCGRVTKTFAAWSSAFKTLQDSSSWPPPRLERPISSFSASELESIVTKMVRLEDNWTSESPTPVKIRSLPLGNKKAGVLVAGGRWFLSGTDDGSGKVWLYDLDADDFSPRILFQWGIDQPCNAQHMTVSIDGDSDRLSFYVAVLFASDDNVWRPDKWKPMTVWAVRITDDGKDLSVRLLRSFNLNGTQFRGSLCIYGDYLARCRADMDLLEIFDWQRSTSENHLKAVINPALNRQAYWRSFRILPNNRLLVATTYWIAVFEYADPSDLGLDIIVTDIPPSQPIWRHALEGIRSDAAPPPHMPFQRIPPDNIPFLMYGARPRPVSTGFIYSLNFKSEPAFEPTIAVCPVKSGVSFGWTWLGWHRGVSTQRHRVPVIGAMQLKAPARSTSIGSQALEVHVRSFKAKVVIEPCGPRYFDEQSGRILFPALKGSSYIVMYFV